MSLVSNLISGSTGNFGLIDPKKYGHETGALRIATESAEALHDIFIEGFYNTEQAELAAVHEGVALEGSQYETVIEASVTSVLGKIKEFFKTLWEKVKAFFHSVKRYIDAIFMSGKEFVKKYDADIRKATNLKDFSYKMYEYTHINDVGTVDIDAGIETILRDSGADNMEQLAQSVSDASSKVGKKINVDDDKVLKSKELKDLKDAADELEKVNDDDKIAKEMADGLGMKGVTEYSDFANACFAYFRNGAEDKSDMEEIDITSLSEYVSDLKSFDMGKLNKASSATDKAFNKAIKRVDSAEKSFNNSTENSDGKKTIMKIFSLYSGIMSKMQSVSNTYFTAWKSAAKERDSAYKSMIVKAIAYSKKKDKNK